MISAVIVEDSRLARLELEMLMKAHPQIKVLEQAATVRNAVEVIDDLEPDLVFLDIHLSGGSGFDVLSKLKKVPVIIFTTAFTDYAFESFEHNTIDYLLKPVSAEKLNRAIQKAEILLGKNKKVRLEKKLEYRDTIFIKERRGSWLVPIEEISMFESKGNYTQVFFNGNRPLLQRSLQQVFALIEEGLFLRVNRKQIVNVRMIREISKTPDGKTLMKLSCNEEVLVSRREMNKIKLFMDGTKRWSPEMQGEL